MAGGGPSGTGRLETAAQLRKRRVKPKRRQPSPASRGPGTVAAQRASSRATQRQQTTQRRRVQRQVSAARREVRKGRGPKADTGNVLRGTRGPTAKEELRASLAALGSPRRLTPLPAQSRSLRSLLERELSGRGAIAKAFGDAASAVGEHALLLQTGPGPAGVAAKRRGGSGLATAMAPNAAKLKDVPLARRAVEDAFNFPAVAVPSLYVPAAGLVEAAMGDSTRIKQVGKDIKENDPLYAAATGDFKRAGKLAAEHPGFTAIEAFGAKGIAGRGAGRAVRGAAKVTGSRKLKSIGAVNTRPAARIPGTKIEVKREYSRDLGRKARQVAADKQRVKRARRLREDAKRVEAVDPDRAITLRKKANQADPRIASDYALKARENLREARNENLRSKAIGEIDQRASRILKESGDKGAGPVLVASGITKASVKDLVKYRDELKAAHAKLTDPGKQAANVRLRAAIDKSIKTAERSGDVDMRQVLAAAQRYSKEIDKPLDKVLDELGLLPEGRGARAKLIPFAARDLGAKVDPDLGVMVGASRPGTPGLQAAARAQREVDPSYVSQSPSAQGPGAYYRASAREPTVSSRARTEKPTLEGTFDARPEALRARAMNAQGLATAAKNFRETIAETALRDKDGNALMNLTSARADALKTALEAKHGFEFEKVAVRPWAAKREQREALAAAIDDGDLNPQMFETFRDGLIEAFQGKGEGPFTLVPRATARQQVQHLRVLNPTDVGKTVRGFRSAFTRTVLTTSPGPTLGNLVEPMIRSAAMRAGPLSTYRAKVYRQELRKIDPEAAKKLEATIGRGKVTLASRKRYVDPKQFDEGTMRKFVAASQAVKRAPGAKRAVHMWDAWTHLVFEVVNGRAEAFYRQGPMLGKVLKDSGLLDNSILGVSRKAMREAAEGSRDTASHALFAKKLNDAYGKYQGFGPTGRKVIAEYTPFAAWFLSSLTFIGKVLPRDHPALLTMIAAAEQATEEWRLAHGLDLFMGEGKQPGWKQGTVPAGKHGSAKLAYNTPFGAVTDPGEAVSSMFFPQGDNFLKALEGYDWKNKKLRHEDGSEYDFIDRSLYGMGELLKSTTPIVAVPSKAKRYIEKPRTLLNPVLIPPGKDGAGATSTSASPAEAKAIEAEADRVSGVDRELELLRREADRLTR